MSRDLAKEVDQALQQDRYDINLFVRFFKSHVMAGTQPDKRLLLGILVQALPRFHTSDFSACISLVQSHVQDAPYIEKELGMIYDLENYLSCGRFAQFWEVWAASKSLLPASPSFEPQMRAGILTVVCSTLERVPVAKMAVYLGVAPAQLQAALKDAAHLAGDSANLVACDSDTVTFAKTMFNAPESDSNQQPLRFADIASIVS
ncbi:translation initiation factor 3 subunit K [Trypanosoma grayi]|uniref:translation initiation factor 3 subunit K n=1 Tax=Trypanosoma grayi TaxID=71804 RepID=UPI0004F48CA6|nr:translation initiation factor 3 subunit K [Trypanosoma grayi]KEG14318.1 translation initiation factor 3 subunit K [Trypanosoma grayi]